MHTSAEEPEGPPEPHLAARLQQQDRFSASEERILVLAPDESDAEAISAAALEGGFSAEVVADMGRVCAGIGEAAGAVVLVDAGWPPADIAALREALRAQPSWSDIPVLLVGADVERDEARERGFASSRSSTRWGR